MNVLATTARACCGHKKLELICEAKLSSLGISTQYSMKRKKMISNWIGTSDEDAKCVLLCRTL